MSTNLHLWYITDVKNAMSILGESYRTKGMPYSWKGITKPYYSSKNQVSKNTCVFSILCMQIMPLNVTVVNNDSLLGNPQRLIRELH